MTGYQYQQSDADIFADTELEYTDSIARTYQKKVYDDKSRYQLYFRLEITGYQQGVSPINMKIASFQ